jgi:DNA-binding MarR family transcriptional regulator
LTRLERDGLVKREADPAYGRKFFAILTARGRVLRAARRRAAPDLPRRCNTRRSGDSPATLAASFHGPAHAGAS